MTKLNEALEVIEKYGWVQGTAKNIHGEHCAVGAVWEVYGIFDQDESNIDAINKDVDILNEVVTEAYPERVRYSVKAPIIAFNDSTLTSLNEVIAVFEKAIAKAEEME